MKAKANRFTIDSMEVSFFGYTFGELWNGWACPYFAKESVLNIIKHMSNGMDTTISIVNNVVIVDIEGEVSKIEIETIDTEVGQKQVYNFGLLGWVWDE